MGEAPQLTTPTPWDLSCPDWKTRLVEGRSLVPAVPLDLVRAEAAVSIFKELRLPDVPGTPTMADAAGAWILDIVAAMFGGFDVATGTRMIRGLFLMLPKKNGKTTYSAAIMLTAAILNKRPRASLILTGPSHSVAQTAFSQVCGMIALDEEEYLQSRFKPRLHNLSVFDEVTGSTLQIKSFDASIVTGGIPAYALIDEIHVLGRDPHAAAIIQQLRGGMVSVPEGFWGEITTQSFVPPAGIFESDLKLARMIRDGDPRATGVDILPVLYEYPEERQKDRAFWENPANWHMLNPNAGKSTHIPRLVSDFAQEKLKGEAEIRIWVSQHLNIEMGIGMHSDQWRGADHWEKAADIKLRDLAELLRRSEVVVMGGDGGGLDDLLGLAVMGREKGTRRRLLWTHAWCHEMVLDRRKSEATQLRGFAEDGDLTIIRELGDDMDEVAGFAEQVVESGLLPEKSAVGVDPVGLGGLVEALLQGGVTREQIVGISQGWKLSGAIMTAERALADGTLIHGGTRLMAYCVGNAKIEPRGSAKLITKQGSGTGKIDPLLAALDALSVLELNPQPRENLGELIDQGRAFI